MVEYRKFLDMPEELQEHLKNKIIDFKISIDEYPPVFQLNTIILLVYDFCLDCEDPYEIYEVFTNALKRTMEGHKRRVERS